MKVVSVVQFTDQNFGVGDQFWWRAFQGRPLRTFSVEFDQVRAIDLVFFCDLP